jgi:hypothetical protein
LLKVNVKRRRSKLEIEEERQLAILKQQEIEEKLAQQSEMQQRINEMQQMAQKGQEAVNFIESLVQRGVLHRDQNGNVNVFEI